MKTKLIIIFCFLLAGGLLFIKYHKSGQEDAPAAAPEALSPYRDAEIKAVVIAAAHHTFGYDIYVYGSVLVHQPSRPGLPGNAGFATEEEAMKVAELVVEKIRNNEMPPTVTIEELRELGVLK